MNLATQYLGLKLAHPIIPGASPMTDSLDQVRRLEDAAAPAIIMHSLFEEQILQEGMADHLFREQQEESFAEAVSFFPQKTEFTLGPQEYLEQIRRMKSALKIPVIGSLNGAHPGGWIEYAKLIEQAGADALELNIYFLTSDPDLSGATIENRVLDIVNSVKETVSIPVAVKLSPHYSALPNLVRQIRDLGAEAVVLFNRFYQPDFDVEALEVRSHLALSTSSELRLRLHWAAILSARVNLPIAISGGVHQVFDVVKSIMAGATAVQVVSCLLKKGPGHIGVLVRELNEFMEEQDYASLDAFRGCLSLKNCPNPEAFERTNYLRTLQLWRP